MFLIRGLAQDAAGPSRRSLLAGSAGFLVGGTKAARGQTKEHLPVYSDYAREHARVLSIVCKMTPQQLEELRRKGIDVDKLIEECSGM